MMSSSCDGPSRTDSWRNGLEENGCLEDKSIPTAERSSSQLNSEGTLTNHSSEVPVTDIDDFITELSKQEQHAESTDAHQAGSAETTITNSPDSATCQQEEGGERGTESPAQAQVQAPAPALSRPSLLEFSTADSGTGNLLPAGKTFLQSYSRNFSNLTEKEVTPSETNGEQPQSGAQLQPKGMYGSMEDSDSESDSTTDRTVQENRTATTQLNAGGGSGGGGSGGGVCSQDTDEEEEEVEICYKPSTEVEQKQSLNDNEPLSPPHYAPPPPPQEGSVDNVEISQAVDSLQKAEHEQGAPNPSLPASTNTQPTQTNSGSVEVNGKSQDILAEAVPVCAPSAGTTVPASVGDAVNGTREANEKVLAPVKTEPSRPPAITSTPVTQNHVTARSQQRTARLLANSPQSSERVRGTSLLPTLNAAETKAPSCTDAKSGGKVSALTTKDKEREREKGQTQNNSSAHSPRSSCLKEHPQPNCKLKPQDNKSLKSQSSSSNAPKLKGLTIKSKSRAQNSEQPLTKSVRAESSVQRKSTASPIQSPKVQAKRVVSVGSPRITRTSEKSSTSSSGRLCERTQDKSMGSATGTTVLTQANVASSAKETSSVQQVAQVSQESLKQNDKDKSETTTTQRTFIEVRLSSSSPTASSTPLLPRKQTVNPSSSIPVPESKSTNGTADLNQLKCETNRLSMPNPKCNSPQTNTAVGITETVDKNSNTLSNGSVDHSLRMASILDAGDHLRSNRSKLYLKAMERRSYSTDIRGLADPNPFSVRQRIKSFENLVGFDKAVVRCIDVPYYAAKPQLNRTLSGCVDSTNGNGTVDGSRSLRRSLSSYADDPVSPPPSPQLRKVTLDSRASDCGVVPVLEEPKLDRSSLAPPVLRQRNSRGPSSLSRSRLRELRALSMPELDKLCTEEFSSSPSSSSSLSSSEAASNVTFKTELEVQPRKLADSSSEGLQYTLVTTRVSRSEGGLQGTAPEENHYQVPRANGQTSASPSWSVSLGELSVAPLEQSKLQGVLTSLRVKVDAVTLIAHTKAQAEIKEDVYFVVLTKEEGSGLGFSIAGGIDLEQKSVTVHRVFTRGAAGVEGTIHRGDAILSINGTSLKGLTHGEALSCLHQSRLPRQALVIIQRGKDSEPPSPRHEPGHAGHSSALTCRDNGRATGAVVEVGADGVLSVELHKTSAGLGFSLDGGKASAHGDRPLNIKRIFKGGAAEQSRVIDVGDEVLAINGRSLQGLMHYDAWNIIKTVSEGPVQLVIRKPRTSV